jgi:hypothetical protein
MRIEIDIGDRDRPKMWRCSPCRFRVGGCCLLWRRHVELVTRDGWTARWPECIEATVNDRELFNEERK